MRPEAQDLDGLALLEDFVDEAVSQVDPAGVEAG
jgi:hypothetical protein